MHGTIGNAQDLSTKLGKVLRLDVSAAPYSIPAGNMSGTNVAPEVWDYGLRNPYRSTFDACTGDLYIGDVGQSAVEEIDVEPAGQGHNNYGWRVLEGSTCYNPATGCDTTGKVMPIAEYDHKSGACSVIGGYVYRGTTIPALRGNYFYGDYCSGEIWRLTWKNGVSTSPVNLSNEFVVSSLSSFGQDTAGEVYVVSLNGTVSRIAAQ